MQRVGKSSPELRDQEVTMTRTSITIHRPPVTDDQKALLARLIEQGRISVQTLIDNDVASMSRGELSRFLDSQFGRPQPSAETRSMVEELFAALPTATVHETDDADDAEDEANTQARVKTKA
jgi:hypothetical protein